MFEEVPVRPTRAAGARSGWRRVRLLSALLAFLVLAGLAPLAGPERVSAQGSVTTVSVAEVDPAGTNAQSAWADPPVAVSSAPIDDAAATSVSLLIVVATAVAVGALVLGSGRYSRMDRRQPRSGLVIGLR